MSINKLVAYRAEDWPADISNIFVQEPPPIGLKKITLQGNFMVIADEVLKLIG